MITPATASTLHQTTPDELTVPPVLIPRLKVLTPVPTTSTQLTHLPTGPIHFRQKPIKLQDNKEPISFELFNKAASELDDKGVINLKKYKKYIAKKTAQPI